MRIRIKDIAEKARVSVGTVDRVIHNRGEVSVSTKQKVQQIISELKYEPDILARTLASKKNHRIAVLIPMPSDDNEFWSGPLEGMKDAVGTIDHLGFNLKEFLYDQFDKASFREASSRFLTEATDALIFAPVFRNESEFLLSECRKSGIDVVLINSKLEHSECLCYIGQDSFVSGQLAGRLISCGLRREDALLVINIAAEKDNYQHITSREQGFIEFFSANDQWSGIHLIRKDVSKDSARAVGQCLAACLDEQPNIRGIFVTNSRVNLVGRYLASRGTGNIRLVGYDLITSNVQLMKERYIHYLISQKPRDQGYRAIMSFFDHRILHKEIEKVQYMPIDIISKENLAYYR